MFSSSALLSLLLIAASTANATPIERDLGITKLGFATTINDIGNQTIPQLDRARIAAMREHAWAAKHGKRAGKPVPAHNSIFTYTASVGIGSPVTHYKLLIDTGSSNTWVGAHKKYIKTHTSKKTKDKFSVTYGSGSVSGDEYIDKVTLAKNLVIQKQSIGAAKTSSGIPSGINGILGLGPVGLTAGTLSPSGDLVPTVVDNLFKHKTISNAVLGVFFEPVSVKDGVANSGELSFGGVDHSKTDGDIAYVPITKVFPASEFWGINGTWLYGEEKVLFKTAGIVDTGTTLVLLATDAFQDYKRRTGAKLDGKTGLLKITEAQYKALKPLTLKFGHGSIGFIFTLTTNAQIWPRSLNSKIGGDAHSIYLIVGDIGTPSGQGLDFVIGYAWLERFYSVYDTGRKRIGFGFTAFTASTAN